MRLTRRPRTGVLLLAVTLSSGCAAWRQVAVAPAALSSEPKQVRITQPDGSRLVILDPRIAGDTLFGSTRDGPQAIPLEDVRRMAVPGGSHSQLMAGTTFVGVALGVFLISWIVLAEGQ